MTVFCWVDPRFGQRSQFHCGDDGCSPKATVFLNEHNGDRWDGQNFLFVLLEMSNTINWGSYSQVLDFEWRQRPANDLPFDHWENSEPALWLVTAGLAGLDQKSRNSKQSVVYFQFLLWEKWFQKSDYWMVSWQISLTWSVGVSKYKDFFISAKDKVVDTVSGVWNRDSKWGDRYW